MSRALPAFLAAIVLVGSAAALPTCVVRSVLHESATYVPAGTGGLSISGARTQYLASRFHVGGTVHVTAVGGQMNGYGGMIFAAIIKLANQNATPISPPFAGHPELTGSATFVPNLASTDFRSPLSATLSSGDYVLVFGSGEFGATGDASMQAAGSSLSAASFLVWNNGPHNALSWTEFGNQPALRFVVETQEGTVEAQGATTGVKLVGRESTGSGTLTYSWTTDCPGGVFDNPNSQNPTLTVNTPSPAVCNTGIDCQATLTLSNGSGSSTCVYNIHIADTMPPIVYSPSYVECSDYVADPSFAGGTVTDMNDPSPIFGAPTDVISPGTCQGESILTRTWPVSDHCGNQNPFVRTIRLVDTTAPEFTVVPPDITVDCGERDNLSVTGAATAQDNCDSAPIVTHEDCLQIPGMDVSPFAPYCASGSITINRIWLATDACGNQNFALQTILLNPDSTPPMLFVPADVTINCSGSTDAFSTGVAAATSGCDPCPAVRFADAVSAGGCAGESTIARTWTATDACGHSTSGVQTITVVKPLPLLHIPADANISCSESTDPSHTGQATATDACDINVSLAVNYSDAATPGCVRITRTWTATDSCGRVSSGDQMITVVDTTAPTLTIPANVTIACAAPRDPDHTGQATATDACDLHPSVTYSDAATFGSCGSSIVTRTWTAADVCGNHVSLAQTITVTASLSFTSTPADVARDCGSDTSPAATGTAVAGYSCGGSVMPTFTDTETPYGPCPRVKRITRTWTAADSCGQSVTHVQTITVEDHTPPSISCPAHVNVTLHGGQCFASGVHLGSPTAGDNCGAVTVTSNAPSVFPAGETIVTWRATDECGLFTECEQHVTVHDTQPPVLRSRVTTPLLWPPNHDLINVGLSVNILTACDAGRPIIVRVYANEDDQWSTGDGFFSPDAKNIAVGTLRLRSERIATGAGRIYLIVAQATDTAGNTGDTTSTVVVPHDRSGASVYLITVLAHVTQLWFDIFGSPPPGFVLVGDGPVIGPKQ